MGAVTGKRPSRPRRADLEEARVARLGRQPVSTLDRDMQSRNVDDEAEHKRDTNKAWNRTVDGEEDGECDGQDDGEDEEEDDIQERRNRTTSSGGRKRNLADESRADESGSEAEDDVEMRNPTTVAKPSTRMRKVRPLPKKPRSRANNKKKGKVEAHSNPSGTSTGLVELTQIQTRHELELDQIELDRGILGMHRDMWLKYGEAYVKTGIFPYSAQD